MPRKKIKIIFDRAKTVAVSGRRPRPARNTHAIDKLLSNIYENIQHPDSFSSIYRLFQAAKKEKPDIKLNQVRDWMLGNKTFTTHRRLVPRFRRRKVIVRGPKYQYQADLMDYDVLARENDGVTFLLTVIDCFSRFAAIVPIKNKEGPTCRDALKKAFNFMAIPKKLQTDEGGEFHNHACQYFYKKNNIIHFSTFQELKASMVERFNRTVRQKIKKYMSNKRTLRYVDILADLIHGYNKSKHSSLGVYSPEEVNERNKAAVFEHLYGEYLRKKRKQFKFKEGELVRLASYRSVFGNKNAVNFTEEVFTVAEALDTKPPMYRIFDPEDNEIIPGPFYEPQMQKWKPFTQSN